MTMKCADCGGTFREKKGPLTLRDPYIGTFTVEDTEYSACDGCGETLLTDAAAKRLETERSRRLDELVKEEPIGAFMTGTEAAAVLGVSRQALHKHRRIRRGFIFQTRFGGGTVYLRRSVESYLSTGDGRFPLVRWIGTADRLERLNWSRSSLAESQEYSSPVTRGGVQREWMRESCQEATLGKEVYVS